MAVYLPSIKKAGNESRQPICQIKFMKGKNYHKFSIDQLAKDPWFQRWVLNPTKKDLLFWQQFLAEHPDQLEKVQTAKRRVESAAGSIQPERLRPLEKKKMHERLMEAVRRDRKRFKIRTLTLSAAAAVLLLIVAGIVLWNFGASREESVVVVSTPYGETKEVSLPDGSKVVLNANSTITYPQSWEAGADRTVQLRGEAHFTVAPKPATQAKFIVVTNDLRVNVLGTVFNVYAREQGTKVTLEEGKVILNLNEQRRKKKPTIKMIPGEQVYFSAQTGQLKEEKVNVTAKGSWKDGIIVFDGITIGELGEIIRETFGKKVEFKDTAMTKQLITGAGPADDLELLLETVEKAFAIKVTRRDSLLIFEQH